MRKELKKGQWLLVLLLLPVAAEAYNRCMAKRESYMPICSIHAKLYLDREDILLCR
jgi:hypothetical protein